MNPDKKKQQLNAYARYSGMAIQMMVIITLGVFGGYKLDDWLETGPLFTIILSIGSVFAAIYLFTKDLIRKK